MILKRKKHIIYIFFSLAFIISFCTVYPSGKVKPGRINDGPYIFKVRDKLRIRWIENNSSKRNYITQENFPIFQERFNLMFNYEDLTNTYSLKPKHNKSYSGLDSISVLSDIHGEYNSYINLLKANGIIDDNLHWNFGHGHFVVLGDIFNRGDMVTEVLWHLFGLEKQAAQAGGMVHLLLGNHEVMTLNKNLSYLSEKYTKVEAITGRKYYNLYPENSVLGRWLRSKPVMITINNILFIHAGISMELVKKNLSIEQINQIFFNKIVAKELNAIDRDQELKFLDSEYGPLWYRGYFMDDNFTESRLDSILHFFGKEHIVVGHTVCEGILSLFNNKILGIDTGITNNQTGEMLIYKNGIFYKGYITGERIKL